jgi:hypothetical protein
MRRHVVIRGLLIGGLLALACTGDRSSLPTELPQFQKTAAPKCEEERIKKLIKELLPKHDGREDGEETFKRIQKYMKQGNTAAARALLLPFVQSLLAAAEAGDLLDPHKPHGRKHHDQSQVDALAELIGGLYVCVGLAPPPGLTIALGDEGAVAVVTPSDPPTVVETGDDQAGVSIPTGAISKTQTVLVTITPDPNGDNPFPNTEGLEEFPPFYNFQTFPEVANFQQKVLVGICVELPEDAEQAQRLQLAHPRHPDLTSLELLERVPADFLNCEPIGRAGSDAINLAQAGRAPFVVRLAQHALALFRPQQLHAAMAVRAGGMGGETGNFSDFRAVDPGPGEEPFNWTPQSSGTTNILFGVGGTSPNNVFAVGDAGTIRHYDGEGWSAQSSGTPYRLYSVWNGVYAVGEGTTILRYFTGEGWETEMTGTPGALTSVWGISAGNAFAVGTGGIILHNDGEGWSTQTSGTTNQLNGVWGSGPADVFAVGLGGKILHYNGNTWTVQTIGALNFRAVWGSSGDDVFAVGDGGTILHYDGESWTTQVSGTTNSLEGVWGTDAENVFAVGAGGTILHYDGTTWRRQTSGTGQFLRTVWGAQDEESTDLFVVGNGGTILHGTP